MHKKPAASRSIANQFTRHYLAVSIIPVILLLVLIIISAVATRNYLNNLITNSTYDLNKDAEHSLQQLGEQIIQAKSRDIARQIEIYFRMHPHTDIRDMRKDPFFMELALQQVGKTGYTAITEARKPGDRPTPGMSLEPVIFRVHKNPAFYDRDMSHLGKAMPEFWAICKRGLDGVETAGYYNWREPDGTFRKKYLYVTPVKTPLNGITIMVSATTYIDEFSLPVVTMRQKAHIVVDNYKNFVSRQIAIFIACAALIVALTILGIFFWGRRTGLRYIGPITQLADTAQKVGEGKWDIQVPSNALEREDEIGVMARSFSHMSQQIKETFSALEQHVLELKQAQDALKISEEHYRSLFDGIPVGLYRSTPDGKFLDVNPMMVQMTGYPDRESFMHSTAEDLYASPRERALWQAQLHRNEGIHPFEIRTKKYDGTEIWVEDYSRAVRDPAGNILYYEGSIKDITERIHANRALKKSEENFKTLYEESKRAQEVYRSLINSSADAIVIYDMEGCVTYTSPMFTTIFGWRTDELVGKMLPFVPESEKNATWDVVVKVSQMGIPCQGFETRRLTKDGRIIDVSLSASRYNDHEEKPAGLLVILRDISAAKRMEAHLQQVERLEAIATLAGGIAHDFNNLLMVIQGTVSLLLYATHESDANYKHFVNIEKQVHRGSHLTKQLLGYARKGKYDIKPLKLNETISENLETLRQTRKDIRIHVHLEENLHVVEADPYQMEQVFMNLFINAADAMESGGDLTIRLKNIPATDIPERLRENRTGAYIVIAVEDTGIGMDKKTVDRIFEPFFTTKAVNKGTGLGLASVYGIVKNHGGAIDVSSEPGMGTTFYIYLPASDKIAPLRTPARRKKVGGQGTVLIIDDEKPVLDITSDILSSIGYTVLKAESGRQGIDLYCREQKRIDLVILDMIMPDISGGDVFDILKEIHPEIAVLLASGYSMDGRAREILARGCKGFIQKPFSMEDLADKVSGMIQQDATHFSEQLMREG